MEVFEMKVKKYIAIALTTVMCGASVFPALDNNPIQLPTNSLVQEIDANAASYTTGNYTVSVSAGVNVRSSRSTANKKNIVGAAAYGKDCIITKVVGSWGWTNSIRCTNGWRSGWIYLPNLTKGFPAKIAASSLRLRKKPGSTASSNTVLTTIPRNKVVIITAAKHHSNSTWVKTTYNGKTGWICWYEKNSQYVYGISDFGTGF